MGEIAAHTFDEIVLWEDPGRRGAVRKLLADSGVMAGTSAGASMMSETMLLRGANQESYASATRDKGLSDGSSWTG